MIDIQFLDSISSLQAEQISAWLKEDKDPETGIGLFGNWEFIRNDIDAKNSVIAIKNDNPIGFITFSINGNLATIKYAGVKKQYRNTGVSRKLTELVFEILTKKRVLVIDLFCAPPETRNFWQKLGFFDALKSFSSQGPRMYIPLVESMKTYQKDNTLVEDEFLQLWDMPSHLIDKQPPMFIWKLDFTGQSRKLISPIIFPCLPDWQLRHIVDGQIITNQKVSKHKLGLYKNDFLIVTRL